MLSQRQAQSEQRIRPLLRFSKDSNSCKIDSESLEIIKHISSPLAIVTMIGLGNEKANQQILRSVFKQQCEEETYSSQFLEENVWMSRKAIQHDHKDYGKLNILVIGGNIQGDSKDNYFLKILSQLGSCIIFNSTNQLQTKDTFSHQQKFSSLLNNVGLISSIPALIVSNHSQQNDKFEDYLKQNEAKTLLESIKGQFKSKQIIQIQSLNEEQLQPIRQIIERRISPKYSMGVLMNGEMVIQKLEYLSEERSQTFEQFHQNKSESLEMKNNNDELLKEIEKERKGYQSLKIKHKQIQQKYQSTKRYVEIMRKQHQEQIKEIRQQYQTQVNDISKGDGKNKNEQLQSQIQQISEKLREMEKMNKQMSAVIENHKQDNTNKSNYILLQSAESNQTQISNLNQQVKRKDKLIEQLKSKIKGLDKQLSIISQRQQLHLMQLESIKTKYNEAKRSESKALDLLEMGECKGDTSFMIVGDEINSKLSQIQIISKSYETKTRELEKEIKLLKQSNNEAELKYNILFQEKIDSNKLFKIQIETEKKKLVQEIKKYNLFVLTAQDKLKEQQNAYQEKISKLEHQLQEFKDNMDMTIQQNKDVSQADVLTIKGYYQQERILKEKKHHDEKQKLENKNKKRIEEIEARHREELDELIQQKDETLSNMNLQQEQFENIVKSLESEQIVKMNQITNLSSKIKYLSQTHASQILQTEAETKQLVDSLKQQIERLKQKYQQFRESTMTYETKIITLEKNIEVKTRQFTQLTESQSVYLKQNENIKKQLSKLHDELRKTTSMMTDQSYESKIENQKMSILNDQYKQFTEQKIKELETLLEQNKVMYEKQIGDMNQKLVEKGQKEILNLEQKNRRLAEQNEELSKVWKDKQVVLLKKVSEIETVVAKLNERIIDLQRQLYQKQKQMLSINSEHQKKILQLKQRLKDKQSSNFNQVQQLSSKVKELQTSKTSLEYENQKSKVLWEGKFAYLENQKKSQKEEHEQKIKRLTGTIEFLKSKQKPDNIQQTVKNIESQYLDKIKDLGESKLKQELKDQQTIRLLTLELKSEKQKIIQLQNRSTPSVLGVSNKSDKSYELQIERIRQEKQEAISSHQQSHYSQKESLRSKIKTLESKLHELEKTRSFHLFEQQKNQSKWNIQKQHFKETIKELEESLSSLKYTKQKLQKQNQTMKVEKRKYKNLNVSMMGMKNSSMLGSFSKWEEDKMKSINVKDYSIFGSDSKTPDVLSNSQDSIIDQRLDQDKVRTDQ